jgi:hypothetical protein
MRGDEDLGVRPPAVRLKQAEQECTVCNDRVVLTVEMQQLEYVAVVVL